MTLSRQTVERGSIKLAIRCCCGSQERVAVIQKVVGMFAEPVADELFAEKFPPVVLRGKSFAVAGVPAKDSSGVFQEFVVFFAKGL